MLVPLVDCVTDWMNVQVHVISTVVEVCTSHSPEICLCSNLSLKEINLNYSNFAGYYATS